MLSSQNKSYYKNYYFDFDFELMQNELQAKEMPFYFLNQNIDQSNCLKDFSMCYSETTLYLIWGRIKNNFKSNAGMGHTNSNADIYAYDIKFMKWRAIKLQGIATNLIVRLNTSSCCFKLKKENYIFVFGGYCDSNQSHYDIYNIVDMIKFQEESDIANHHQFNKSAYKESYKPQLDSQAIPIQANRKPQSFQILLLGGTFSKFLYNQDQKPLSIYSVKIGNDEKLIFENLTKNPEFIKKNKEGLNLLFASQNKNYFFDAETKKMMFAPSFFSKQKEGIFLEFNESNGIFGEEKNVKQLAEKRYQMLTRLEINLEKKEKKYFFHKFFIFMFTLKFDTQSSALNTVSSKVCMKYQDQPLFEINKVSFLNDCFEFQVLTAEIILIDEEVTELILLTPIIKNKNEDYSIQRIGFYVNDLKKTQCSFFDYIPTRLKSTNYSLSKNIVYILVNNEKDTNCKRIVYALDLKTINKLSKSRFELIKVFEETSQQSKSFFKGCSITSEESKLFIVGGEISDPKKYAETKFLKFIDSYLNENVMVEFKDMKNHTSYNFPSNLNEMQSPYVVSSSECLFCINRNIIKNPFLEMDFYNKNSEEINDALGSFKKRNGNYLYGELIRKNNIKNEEWNCFLIDLENCEIVLTISFWNGLFIKKTAKKKKNVVPHVSFGLIFLGKITKPEAAGFLYIYKEERQIFPSLKENRLFYIDFEEIQNIIYKNGEHKSIKKMDLNTKDLKSNLFINEKEYLVRLRDSFQVKENEIETVYFKQNLEKICFDEEFQKLINEN